MNFGVVIFPTEIVKEPLDKLEFLTSRQLREVREIVCLESNMMIGAKST